MKAPKKIPQRKCVVCQEREDKKQLMRIVRQKDGNIQLDPTRKLAGRGAYLCQSAPCLEKAIRGKALNRAFRTEISPQVYQDLARELENLE